MTKKVKTSSYSFDKFCLKLASKWNMGGFNYSLDSLRGDKENRSKDILGRVYEYFLGQFASAEDEALEEEP